MQVFELPVPDPHTLPPPLHGADSVAGERNREHVAPRLVAFSPDGRLLAAWAAGRVFVVDCVAGSVRTLWNAPDTARAEGSALAFTSDGRYVLARHAASDSSGRDPPEASVFTHDAETGATARTFPLHGLNDGLAATPDGRTVIVARHPTPRGNDAEFVRWDPLTGERSEPFARHRGVVRQMAMTADGRWLAGTFGDELRVWHLAGKKPPARAARQQSFGKEFVVSLAISADGAFAAAGEFKGSVRLIEAGSRATRLLGARPRGYGRDLAFHPTRPLLAYSGENEDVVIYDAATQTELKRFAWGIGDVSALAFSAEGLRCAAASVGKVVVWDVDV